MLLISKYIQNQLEEWNLHYYEEHFHEEDLDDQRQYHYFHYELILHFVLFLHVIKKSQIVEKENHHLFINRYNNSLQ